VGSVVAVFAGYSESLKFPFFLLKNLSAVGRHHMGDAGWEDREAIRGGAAEPRSEPAGA